MITWDMVKFGYDSGLINLILSPNGDGIACSIGDNWFYFGGHTAEKYDVVESYKRDISAEDIIKEIYEVLEDFSSDIGFEDEYLYYEYYLREKILDPNITKNPEGKVNLEIDNSFVSEEFTTIYTVSLAHGFFVDVKISDETGLIYVMENHDGSTVYGIAGTDAHIPNYNYDEASVIKFVKDFHKKEKEKSKESLSEQIHSASTRAAEAYLDDSVNVQKLCDAYNRSDLEALLYLKAFCKGNNCIAIEDLIHANLNFYEEGHNEKTSIRSEDEYHDKKWELFKLFGVAQDSDGQMIPTIPKLHANDFSYVR